MDEATLKNLRKIQLLQLDIAKAVKELCLANDIPFFLIGGTLLGAVRHKGFIPWDDDLDIGMLRADYERFLIVAQKQLNSKKFFLETWNTEKNYGFPFTKIKLNGTKNPEPNAPSSIHQGIFIDIFPIDVAAPTKRKGFFHLAIFQVLYKFFLYKKGYVPRILYNKKSDVKFFLARIIGLVAKIIPDILLKKSITKILTFYDKSSNVFAVNLLGAYGYKEICSRKGVAETIMLPFEDTDFPVPIGYKEYLSNMYGDYMQLPPENKRYNRHGNYDSVDFGEYA
jgi:lipopolysaccharide cholinephosphotransferase